MIEDRPIDTAPRDDSEILLWCDDGVWRKARWLRDDIWVTSDGEMQIRGTSQPDPMMVTAVLWAPISTGTDDIAPAAMAAEMTEIASPLPD